IHRRGRPDRRQQHDRRGRPDRRREHDRRRGDRRAGGSGGGRRGGGGNGGGATGEIGEPGVAGVGDGPPPTTGNTGDGMIVGRALDEGVSGGEPASEVGTPGE